MEIKIIPVNEVRIGELARLADEIWHEYFPCILEAEQIDYMVNKFQSDPAIREQIKDQGYNYYFICDQDVRNPIGYIGVKPEEDSLFLSKLYLKAEYRGRGVASRAFAFMEELCTTLSLKSIYLTVNRFNTDTIAVYRKKGFEVIQTRAADIGSGYVMDDFIMKKLL